MDGSTDDRGQTSFRHHYTRDGFVGSHAEIQKGHYVPAYTRIEGDYAPRRFDIADLDAAAFAEPHGLPVPLLTGDGVTLGVAQPAGPMAHALRNVVEDELHYAVVGDACLETDFGVLEVRAGDFVLIPRAIAYRFARVSRGYREIVLASPGRLTVDPAPAQVLNVAAHVDSPIPFDDPVGAPGEREVIVRHPGGVTSYFYEFDPLRCIDVVGNAQVCRFNIENARGLGVTSGGITPARLIDDDTGLTLVYHLGARRSDRPPIHINADYDELIMFAAGPGVYGQMNRPGTIAWTPKGVPHHGAEEDVPTPYQAWLIETRAPLAMTAAGKSIGRLMETGEYGFHQPADGVGV